MANMSNAQLWDEVKGLRDERTELTDQNTALDKELQELNAQMDRAAVTIEALEHEVRRLEKVIAGAPTEKKMAHECRTAYARGFNEGKGKR